MKVIKKTTYQCPECLEIYYSQWEAERCLNKHASIEKDNEEIEKFKDGFKLGENSLECVVEVNFSGVDGGFEGEVYFDLRDGHFHIDPRGNPYIRVLPRDVEENGTIIVY